MDKGLILALLAAVSFAASVVFIRKASARSGESFTATTISAFTGVPFFAVVISFTGEWGKLALVSWRAFALLGIAGIIHFVIGRMLGYTAYRLIGANKATTFIMTTPFYTVILGIIFLGEHFTAYLATGVLCIVGGAALITTEKESVNEQIQKGLPKIESKGMLAALASSICWGASPILIKPAIAEIGSPFIGAFVSYAAASAAMVLLFSRRKPRAQLARLSLPSILTLLLIGGVLASAGQLFLYTALVYSPASMVSSIIGTQIFFVFIFSLFMNRQIEVFTLKVILGMVVTIAGTFLLFQ